MTEHVVFTIDRFISTTHHVIIMTDTTSNARLCNSLDPRLILAQLSSLSSFLLYS